LRRASLAANASAGLAPPRQQAGPMTPPVHRFVCRPPCSRMSAGHCWRSSACAGPATAAMGLRDLRHVRHRGYGRAWGFHGGMGVGVADGDRAAQRALRARPVATRPQRHAAVDRL